MDSSDISAGASHVEGEYYVELLVDNEPVFYTLNEAAALANEIRDAIRAAKKAKKTGADTLCMDCCELFVFKGGPEDDLLCPSCARKNHR